MRIKIITSSILSVGLLAAGTAVSASIGDVVGHVYSTDILATVNSVPIPSYSLDGKTAIALRDLENYGFSVDYDDETRSALVQHYGESGDYEGLPAERGIVGEIVGDVLETDITAYINGVEVPSYNIGGRLVAAIEDIAPWDDSSDYSECGFARTGLAYSWDEESRTVALERVVNNVAEAALAAKNLYVDICI